jgi:hypothetical protein
VAFPVQLLIELHSKLNSFAQVKLSIPLRQERDIFIIAVGIVMVSVNLMFSPDDGFLSPITDSVIRDT